MRRMRRYSSNNVGILVNCTCCGYATIELFRRPEGGAFCYVCADDRHKRLCQLRLGNMPSSLPILESSGAVDA